ncbi:MAG: c-type cytochrome [Acidobacteriota bacterium]|nr:c-type cytochrome [Acidobacteriota bacterium]MDH3528757.1 c-type cytochrome [Acidobacteriota bacterium]
MNIFHSRLLSVITIFLFSVFAMLVFFGAEVAYPTLAQEEASPTPEPTPEFDQAAAIAKIRDQIKGKEKLPAGEVFKNVKDFAQMPAERILAVMEFGYAKSLGVDCTHCHTPENWASDEKREKKIAREMRAMANKINGELLGSIKEFESRTGRNRPVVNCTTCHRGAVIPATNLGK